MIQRQLIIKIESFIFSIISILLIFMHINWPNTLILRIEIETRMERDFSALPLQIVVLLRKIFVALHLLVIRWILLLLLDYLGNDFFF